VSWWEGFAAGVAALAGVALLARRAAMATGWLLLAAAVTVPLVAADVPGNGPGFTAFLLLAGPGIHLQGMFALLAGYTWPMAPPHRGARLVVGAVLGCTAGLGAVAPALFFDPVSAGCNACARNLLEVAAAPALSEALQRCSMALALVWAPALAALTGAGWARATRLGRRQGLAVLVGTVGMTIATTAAAFRGLWLPIGAIDDVGHRLWAVQCAMLAVLAAGVVAQQLLTRAAAARMAGRVIAAIPDPETVQTWLRDSVGDPDLTVTFVRDDGVRVDADGVPVTAGDPRPVVRLTRDGAVFAEVRSASRSSQDLELARACATSAGLALEYVAARARLRAEVRESGAVRARIVAAGDRERRRLERNLHDGAQQRLVALGVMLASVTRSTAGEEATAYHREIDSALAELRTLARGLFPASLGEADVDGALRELGDHTRIPLLVRGGLSRDVPLPVAMAIYRLVLDASRVAPPTSVLRVRLGEPGDHTGSGPASVSVTVSVTVTGPDLAATRADGSARLRRPHLLHAEDRFVALGGRLTGVVRPDAFEWEGTVPCG
jgi:signal transduction histidine kinase